MSILSTSDFVAAFDIERVEQLASRYDATMGSYKYDSSIIDTLITQAQGTIYNYLTKLYSTLELDADSGIKRLCLNLTMYYLEQSRGKLTELGSNNYNAAMSELAALRDGVMKLASVNEYLPLGNTDETDLQFNDTEPYDLFDNLIPENLS